MVVRGADYIGMNNNLFYVPGSSTDGFVELARSRKGRLFKKQILHFGSFAHPNSPDKHLIIDMSVAEALVRNFRAGVADIVQVPIVNDANQHSEDPMRNIGEVVDLSIEDDGVYATIDARKPEAADQLGRTLLGASAMMHMNYRDTKSGKAVGPALLHVAITNRPYITNLADFEEVVAASADYFGSGNAPVVLTPHAEGPMDLDQIKALLKSEHGIDLDALQMSNAGSNDSDLLHAFSSVLREAGAADLDEDTLTVQDVAEAVIELSQQKVELAEQMAEIQQEREELRLSQAQSVIADLVTEGRILPKQKDVMATLYLSNRETFDALLPETAVVSMSETGVTAYDEPEQGSRLTTEIDRLSEMANKR